MRENFPNSRPKDAATLILLDRGGRVPKVLMGRRHEGHVFLPGKFVFPGGRVDSADRLMPVARPLNPLTEKRLLRHVSRPTAAKARAFVLSAIRETFEETGLLLGRKCADVAKAPTGPWSEFAKAKVQPDLSTVHYIARAITPPRRPRRYDARFFTADAADIAHRVDGIVGPKAELVELVWLPIADATKLDLIPITQLVLRDLQAAIDAGFRHGQPVPFYRMLHGKRVRDIL
ncbi:MAG TPA: NUDIX hydrolase [Terriglobales bacterium]|nr:NUDIX hydrolase [Terriglobales bacterium]